MPYCNDQPYGSRRRGSGWKYMKAWERKQFYRENESRVRRGMKPLPKPESRYDGGVI